MGKIKPHNREQLNKNAFKTKSKKDKSKLYRHIYNSKKWKDLRKKYIDEHPTCECCGKEAEQVHHIKKFSTGKNKKEIEKLAYDYNNLMSLCKHCHVSKHNHEKNKSIYTGET